MLTHQEAPRECNEILCLLVRGFAESLIHCVYPMNGLFFPATHKHLCILRCAWAESCDLYLPGCSVTEWKWLVRINGLLSSGTRCAGKTYSLHGHHADVVGTWSQRSSPGVPPAAGVSSVRQPDIQHSGNSSIHIQQGWERERETTRETWGGGWRRWLWRRERIRCCRADGMIASWSNR